MRHQADGSGERSGTGSGEGAAGKTAGTATAAAQSGAQCAYDESSPRSGMTVGSTAPRVPAGGRCNEEQPWCPGDPISPWLLRYRMHTAEPAKITRDRGKQVWDRGRSACQFDRLESGVGHFCEHTVRLSNTHPRGLGAAFLTRSRDRQAGGPCGNGKHGGGTPPGPAFPAPFPAPRRADSPPARTQGPLGGVPRAPGRPSRRAIPRPPRCSVPACPRDLCASLMAWGAYWNGPGGLCARGNRPAWRATDTPSRPQSSPHSSSSDANHDACEEISGQTGVGGQPQLHLGH